MLTTISMLLVFYRVIEILKRGPQSIKANFLMSPRSLLPLRWLAD